MARALLLAALIGGCSSSEPLAECMVGWWRNPLFGGCLCPPEPECAFGDCQSLDWTGYLADGTTFGGTIAWSKSNGTMSEEGAASKLSYAAAENGIVTFTRADGSMFTFPMTCSGDRLTIEGVVSVRAEPGLASALMNATAAGLMWQSLPVSF
jgi:hypothetical protein